MWTRNRTNSRISWVFERVTEKQRYLGGESSLEYGKYIVINAFVLEVNECGNVHDFVMWDIKWVIRKCLRVVEKEMVKDVSSESSRFNEKNDSAVLPNTMIYRSFIW